MNLKLNCTVCLYVCLLFEKFSSVNASSLLKCLLKPEGRAWAAGGGPEASKSVISNHNSKFISFAIQKLTKRKKY